MISRLKPHEVDVRSLTTIATPHRGSAFADYMFERIGRELISKSTQIMTKKWLAIYIPKLYKVLEYFGLETGAFSQLTQKYMEEEFNPKTPDDPNIR
jgi:triacylglycerol lipase